MRVRHGGAAGTVRTLAALRTWHNANDLADVVRAIKLMPRYVDHTVKNDTIIVCTFR